MSAPIICGNPSCSLAQTRQIAWQFAGFFMALFTTKKERSQCFRIDFFPFWQGQEDSEPMSAPIFAETHRAVLRRRGKLHGNLRDFSFCLLYEKEKQSCLRTTAFLFGRGRRIRTRDPRFWRPVLYQLSYTPVQRKVL